MADMKMRSIVALLAIVSVCQGARQSMLAALPKTTSTAMTIMSEAVSKSNPTTATIPTLPPPQCPEATSTISPLGRLRAAMVKTTYTQTSYLDAFLVFYSDEHLSEEPAPEERRLQYISGWDGPGTAAVMADPDQGAALWVPSGEVMRAKKMVSCAWLVLDADDYRTNIPDWILSRISRPGRVGGDARLTSVDDWQAIAQGLNRTAAPVTLVPVSTVVDQIWAEEPDPMRRRPEYSKIVANLHNSDYTGLSWQEKITTLRKEIVNTGADAMVVTALDEVAWLLNVRGRDTPYAPLLKAFVIVSLQDVKVYAPQGKVTMPVRDGLSVYSCYKLANCTRINDYMTIYTDLRRAPESKIIVPAASTFGRGASEAISSCVPFHKRVSRPSPIIDLKAQKNPAEIKGMHDAHLKDAVAMCTLLSYLEGMVKVGLNEVSVGVKVDVTRGTQPRYLGVSMATRVAFGPSAAEPDYRPEINSSRSVTDTSTMIIRSGGQYDEGTTMVTRTVHYGKPTADMKTAYTTVLRSLAAMATLQVPESLPAPHTDPVIRGPLWAQGQDYPHPTGHGIGAALNRREDPVVIDYRQDTNLHPYKERYFVTAEPAWYDKSGKYGVRLGNVFEVVSMEKFLAFKEATLVPFEPKLIDRRLLTEYEIKWLNAYNRRIRKVVGPELVDQGLIDVFYWMNNKTIPYELGSVKPHTSAALRTCAAWTLVFAVVGLLQ